VNFQHDSIGTYITLLIATLRERRVSLILVTFLPHCGEVIESRAKFKFNLTNQFNVCVS